MVKEFYTTIRDAIKAIPEITSVSLWQNNLINSTDRLNRFPLVYIEMQPVEYGQMSNYVDECEGARVVVHIIHKTIDPEDLKVFSISQKIYVALRALNYRRITELPSYPGGELVEWQITFEAPRFTDSAAVPAKTTQVKPPIDIDESFNND